MNQKEVAETLRRIASRLGTEAYKTHPMLNKALNDEADFLDPRKPREYWVDGHRIAHLHPFDAGTSYIHVREVL